MPDIFSISDRLVDDLCELQPVLATVYGIEGYDDRWGDTGVGGAERLRSRLERARREVAALPSPSGRWDELGRRVLDDHLALRLDELEQRDHLREVSSVVSPLQEIREAFDIMPKQRVEDWNNIVARLESLSSAFSGYRQRLDAGRAENVVAARRQVLAAAEQATVCAGAASPLQDLIADFDASGVSDTRLRTRLVGAVERGRAAYGDLAHYFTGTYLAGAEPGDGVGRARYVRHAASFLGSTLDPEETYDWGWHEVERIRARMHAVADLIVPGETLAATLNVLKTDAARAAPSPAAFVEIVRRRQEEALVALAGVHFDIPEPIRTIEVRLAPYHGGALGAYYHGPSEDFSRPGTIWYALAPGTTSIPLYDEISTAYHEGFPGHHLQVGLQVSLADRLTRMHRLLMWTSGYGEGWALYAEQLMDELGYLERPDYQFGLLASQMLRACRVVIDIGLHVDLPIPDWVGFHPGERWTFARAVDLLGSYAFLGHDYSVSEVTRYLGWPGQAISYKVGERVILELRDEVRRLPGFDLRRFHAAVLGSGPVGLDHLREIVLGDAGPESG